MSNREPLLEVKNLTVTFTSQSKKKKEKKVVRSVDNNSFTIFKGETFGLVGESGCGKTTTGRAIIRLYNPDSGEMKFNGKDISGKMNKDLRGYITDNISMIFQDPVDSLNPRMTVKEIIREGLDVKGIGSEKDRDQMVFDMLDKVGLTKEHAGRYPHEFSGGQRQRIGIARAIITNPALVIADEPVSALDVSIQAQIINLLNKLQKELGLTILFVAHDLSVVKYFSDRVAVMYSGKIVEIAPSEALYKNPIHPYTKSLLSSIPDMNPIASKRKNKFSYEPDIAHDYSNEKPEMREIAPDHFVHCSESEFLRYKESLR